MNENYQALFQCIREKCQRRGWYGADGDNPYEEQRVAIEVDQYHLYATYDLYDEEGNAYTFDKFEPGFVYPPATEEQLVAAEVILGFPLPPSCEHSMPTLPTATLDRAMASIEP